MKYLAYLEDLINKMKGLIKMKETVLMVRGMMCGGCENRVKNAIKNISGVENVIADYNTGKVVVNSDDSLSKDEIKAVLEDIGYEVIGE